MTAIKQLRVDPEAPRWYPRWACGARIKADATRAEARVCRVKAEEEWRDPR